MEQKTVAVAGGSGFIGRAIVRRMAATGGIKARVLTRNPDSARKRLDSSNVEFVRADISEPATLAEAQQHRQFAHVRDSLRAQRTCKRLPAERR